MQTPDWISLSLAIVTLLGVIIALIFGIRSIRENRVLQVIKYKIELLEKLSNWLNNIQTCIVEDHLPDDYVSVRMSGPSAYKGKEFTHINWHRRRNAFFKVIEEGKSNGLAIAFILGTEMYEAVKSLMNYLQTSCETFIKYTNILDNTSNDDELVKTLEDFEKEHSSNLSSLNETTTQLLGKILNTRISLFDCYFSGSDPFKQMDK